MYLRVIFVLKIAALVLVASLSRSTYGAEQGQFEEMRDLAANVSHLLVEARSVIDGYDGRDAAAKAACEDLLRDVNNGDLAKAAIYLDEIRTMASNDVLESLQSPRPLDQIYQDFRCALGKVSSACQNTAEVQTMRHVLSGYHNLFKSSPGYLIHYAALLSLFVGIPVKYWHYFANNPGTLAVPYMGLTSIIAIIGFYYSLNDSAEGEQEDQKFRETFIHFTTRIFGIQLAARAWDSAMTKRDRNRSQAVFWQELWQQLKRRGFNLPRYGRRRWFAALMKRYFVDSIYTESVGVTGVRAQTDAGANSGVQPDEQALAARHQERRERRGQ